MWICIIFLLAKNPLSLFYSTYLTIIATIRHSTPTKNKSFPPKHAIPTSAVGCDDEPSSPEKKGTTI